MGYKFLIPLLLFHSVLTAMPLREKVGQLFMIELTPADGAQALLAAEEAIVEHGVGGIVWFQGTPELQIEWIERCQQLSRVPLLMAQDLEYGLSMRLCGTSGIPRARTLGAIRLRESLVEAGREVGRQSRLVGIQLVLAPVVDVASNPDNPAIGMRSFGSDPHLVSEAAAAFLQGLTESGVAGCAKHFPGHGDTSVDSHVALPLLNLSRAELEERELIPFRRMVEEGVPAIMVGHIACPKIDEEERPASRSPLLIQAILRDELGYEGVIMTDALDMKGAEADPGFVAVEALLAGNDLLLMPTDLSASIEAVIAAVEEGRLSEDRISASVERLLALKERVGSTVAVGDLETEESRSLRLRLYLEAMTPLSELPRLKKGVDLVQVGREGKTPFSEAMGLEPISFERREEALEDQLLVALYRAPPAGVIEWLTQMEAEGRELLILFFASPDLLPNLPGAILLAYEEVPEAQRAAATVILREE